MQPALVSSLSPSDQLYVSLLLIALHVFSKEENLLLTSCGPRMYTVLTSFQILELAVFPVLMWPPDSVLFH